MAKSKPAAPKRNERSTFHGEQNETDGPAHTVETPPTSRAWDRFWFDIDTPCVLVPVRLVVCLLSALWLLSIAFDTVNWFGEDGWSAVELDRRLSVSTEGVWPAGFRITPLWMTSSAMVIQAWAFAGLVLSALAALGVGQRWVRLALFLNILWLAQRMTWSTGAFEPYLIALLGYLLIGPSCPWRPFSARKLADGSQPSTWMATFSLRLIQVHTFILLGFTLASLLSADVWWRGEGVWFLAASGHSNLLSAEWLIDRELLVNFLSHAIVVSCLMAVGLYWTRDPWRVGQASVIITAASIGLVGDQLLYGALLAAASIATRPATRAIALHVN